MKAHNMILKRLAFAALIFPWSLLLGWGAQHVLDGGVAHVDIGNTQDAGPHQHCWHPSSLQHTVENHRDDVCCWCRQYRCVKLPSSNLSGHGPYAQSLGGLVWVIPDAGSLNIRY